MNKPPAFQFYVRDFLSSATVRTMSMHHRGVYITVLAAMWDSDEPGTLPLPLEVAARSAGLDPRSLRDFVAKSPRCLVEIDGKLVNRKLRAQWEEMLQFKQKLSDAGKRGNEARWDKASGGDSGGDRSASASASASAKSKPKPTAADAAEIPPSCGKAKGQKPAAPPQQRRYAIIGRLAQAADEILSSKPDRSHFDLAEDLKEWAASRGIPYFDAWPGAATPIQQAIEIAIEKRKTA